MKNLISIFMTIIMTLMISVPALANGVGGSITINNTPDKSGVSMVGHTYEAYKIMDTTIKLDENNKQIFEYKVVGTPFENFFKSMQGSESDKLDLWATDYIRNSDLNELSENLKIYIEAQKIAPNNATKAIKETVKISDLPLGYYLVLDKGAGDSTGSASVIASASLGTTNNDLVIELKASAPTIDKDIYHNEIPGVDNVGDNSIGDKVSFRLTAKIPSNLTGYETYKYIIHDTMSKGLTFNGESDFNGVFVPISGNNKDRVETDYYTLKFPAEDGDTFDLSLNVLKATSDYAADEAAGVPPKERRGFPAGGVVEVFYDAKLNKDAEVAPSPNTNEVHLEYSNNPSVENSTTTTPDIMVKDYTFAFKALKTGEDGETPLAGAEFKLEVDATGRKETIYYQKASEDEEGKPLPYIEEEDGTRVYYVCNENHNHINDFDKIVTSESGKFRVVGLDDAYEYTLIETKAPDGYTTIDPIDFRFNVEYDEDGNIIAMDIVSNGDVIGQDNFVLNTTIINTTGNKLPETGGIGRTIFKVVGGVLMISAIAGVVIATKKDSKKRTS